MSRKIYIILTTRVMMLLTQNAFEMDRWETDYTAKLEAAGGERSLSKQPE